MKANLNWWSNTRNRGFPLRARTPAYLAATPCQQEHNTAAALPAQPTRLFERGLLAAAFTLTELLVVMAVLALLVATQVPALTRARTPTNLTKCLNNCRRIGQATMLYKADNDDAYPYGNRCLGSGTGAGSVVDPYAWPMQLLRYAGGYTTNTQPVTYVCPNENSTAPGWAFQVHYQANRYFVRDINDTDKPLRGSQIRSPAIYWVFMEKGPSQFCNVRPGGLDLVLLTWNFPPGATGYRRHNGGLTATAADGHAEWLRMPAYQPGRPAPVNFLELGDCATGQAPSPPVPPGPWQPRNADRVKLYWRDCPAQEF